MFMDVPFHERPTSPTVFQVRTLFNIYLYISTLNRQISNLLFCLFVVLRLTQDVLVLSNGAYPDVSTDVSLPGLVVVTLTVVTL